MKFKSCLFLLLVGGILACSSIGSAQMFGDRNFVFSGEMRYLLGRFAKPQP